MCQHVNDKHNIVISIKQYFFVLCYIFMLLVLKMHHKIVSVLCVWRVLRCGHLRTRCDGPFCTIKSRATFKLCWGWVWMGMMSACECTCIKVFCMLLALTITLLFFRLSYTWHILTQYQGSNFTGGCQSTFSDLPLFAFEILLKRPWRVHFCWKHFQTVLACTSNLLSDKILLNLIY